MFRSLKARGLRGVQLVTSDDHPGLEAAISRHFFQGASWQRCQFHYSKNLLKKLVGPKKRAQLAEGLREVFACPTRETALKVAGEMAARCGEGVSPASSSRTRRRAHRGMPRACLFFPASHRKRIRTTNGLERFNQEIKRRTRVVRIFPNREACCSRLVTALAVEKSEEWVTGRRYLKMEELLQAEREAPVVKREEREVALM